MKHIKTFESYSPDEALNEEFIGKILKTILAIPITVIAFTVTQFLDPRKLKDQVLPQLLDIYANLDVLIDTLENIHFNKTDITDVEAKAIMSKINALKKIKSKWPTLEVYKKEVGKKIGYLNIKNRKYLADQAMQYEPKKMSAEQVLKEIKKVYKLVGEDDIIGEAPRERDLPWEIDLILDHTQEELYKKTQSIDWVFSF